MRLLLHARLEEVQRLEDHSRGDTRAESGDKVAPCAREQQSERLAVFVAHGKGGRLT